MNEVGKKTQPTEYILRPRREQPEWEISYSFMVLGLILLGLKRWRSSGAVHLTHTVKKFMPKVDNTNHCLENIG